MDVDRLALTWQVMVLLENLAFNEYPRFRWYSFSSFKSTLGCSFTWRPRDRSPLIRKFLLVFLRILSLLCYIWSMCIPNRVPERYAPQSLGRLNIISPSPFSLYVIKWKVLGTQPIGDGYMNPVRFFLFTFLTS